VSIGIYAYLIAYLVIFWAYKKGQYGDSLTKIHVDDIEKSLQKFLTDPQSLELMRASGPSTNLAHYDRPWGIYEKDETLKISNITLTQPQAFPISQLNDSLNNIIVSKYSPQFLTEKTTIIQALYMRYPRSTQIATGPKHYMCILISSIFLAAHNIFYFTSALSGLYIFIL
jgi:nitrogen fixation-related uncharacterized protein